MNEKNATKSICSILEQIEDRISELEDKNFEMTQLEESKEKNMKRLKKSYMINGIPSEEQVFE